MFSNLARPRDIRGRYIPSADRSDLAKMWIGGEVDNHNYLLALDISSERLYKQLTSGNGVMCLSIDLDGAAFNDR